ncbi:hypothetical protein [Mycolicibacterium canariasense]|uniref:hypothetical protein n=1 Tax=Mycolicibacterium canariasense TaxID=228230 RepID=UPI000A16BB35|nr:hypothetical protein [Mycolicibacterium canariasense]MCV7208354.1 hypothetical protein [Mycolicibacterium canariasense]ORV13542.1 hypothetical protein AWB94_04790 [Mycolicibacterium canariasense]
MNSVRRWLRARSHRRALVLMACVCVVASVSSAVGLLIAGAPARVLWMSALQGICLFVVCGGALRLAMAFFDWLDGDDA